MSTADRHSPALVLGVPIDDLTKGEAIAEIAEMVALGRERGTTHQVVTINVDFLVNAVADEEVGQILGRADLAIADGMPVTWGARLAGMPLRERVTGADLVPALADAAARHGWRILLFGSSDGIAEQAADMLSERYPGAQITGWSGSFIADVESVPEDVLERLAAVDADILCVALGNPKQERFIEANRARLRTPVMIGVGGSLDLFVGDRRRAPVWMQRYGLEWVFRALQEPRRLGRRYARDIVIFTPALIRWLRVVRRTRGGDGIAASDVNGTCQLFAAPTGAEDFAWVSAARAFAERRPVMLDLSTSDRLTARAAALTMDLQKRQARYGGSRGSLSIGAGVVAQLDELRRQQTREIVKSRRRCRGAQPGGHHCQ